MLLIDKYTPKTAKDAYFHKKILGKLEKMSKDNSMPSVIFFGPERSGKKTLISIFLEMIYDESVHNLTDTVYEVAGSGNTVTEVNIKKSNYHIVIEPNNTNFDRYLIQNVVKSYADEKSLDLFATTKPFRTVLINNVDRLSYYAQTSLRRTMEKYSDKCRFIMWSRSPTKVIDPLRSRCICINVPAPNDSEIFKRVYEISIWENIPMTIDDYIYVVTRARNNIKEALWILTFKKHGMYGQFNTYDETITTVVGLIIKKDPNDLEEIRNLLYRQLITNIEGTRIIKDIMNTICRNKNISINKKSIICEHAAVYEHNLVRGRRDIIQLEAFVTNSMSSLSQ